VRKTFIIIAALLAGFVAVYAEAPQAIIARAAVAKSEKAQGEILTELMGNADESILPLLDAWRKDKLFLFEAPGKPTMVVLLEGTKDSQGAQSAIDIISGKPAGVRLAADDLNAAAHSANLRRIMKAVLDLTDLSSANPAKKLGAIAAIGQGQQSEKLPALEKRLAIETDPQAIKALREALALVRLKSPDPAVKLAALKELESLQSLASTDFVKTIIKDATAAKDEPLLAAARSALQAVERHRTVVDFGGTLFRSLSLGSILIIVALGLAITFGLMGVINMAHGEMIAIGAYTTYVVQNIFALRLLRQPTRPAYDRLVARILLPLRAAAELPRRRRRRYPARARCYPFPLSPPAGEPARHLGRLAAAPAAPSPHLRRQQCPGRQPGLPQRQLDRRRRPPRLEPCLRHRLRDAYRGRRLARAHAHLGRPAHPQRDAEPPDGRVHGRAHRARQYADLRVGQRPGGTRRRLPQPDRQRRPFARPVLRGRQFHGGRRGRRG
jgi:hypothetical protein